MKKFLIYTSGLLLAISVFLLPHAAHASTYTYYRAITVTSTATVASGTNTNFPMLVSSTLASWEASSTGGSARIQNLCTAPNGSQEPCDLVFATSIANCGVSNLNFETEKYTSSTGALVDWVQVPSLLAGTVIYACYDAASVTTDQSHPSSTWDTNYKGVYHLSDNAANTTVLDSTSNTDNLTSQRNTSNTASTAKIAGGQSWNGSSDYAQSASTANFATQGSLTIQLWINANSLTGVANNLFERGDDNGAIVPHAWGIQALTNGSSIGFYVATSNGSTANAFFITSATTLTTGTWHQISMIFDSAANKLHLYIDGTEDANSPVSTDGQPIRVTGATEFYTLGDNYSSNGRFFNGLEDEFRISHVIRSSSWILSEYNNQSSPSTFYSIGAESVPTNVLNTLFQLIGSWILKGTAIIQ
jgi:hypothetical protein